MPRPKVHEAPRSQLATMIDRDLHEAVRELSDESGIPISRLVEDGLKLLLRKHGRDDKSGWLDRYYVGLEDRYPQEEQ